MRVARVRRFFFDLWRTFKKKGKKGQKTLFAKSHTKSRDFFPPPPLPKIREILLEELPARDRSFVRSFVLKSDRKERRPNAMSRAPLFFSVADALERLVRNSVEARAKEVACDLVFSLSSASESSFPSIRVQDDGEGMTEKDLHLVGESGCTSKRGKRGDSLASIVGASERVEIVTRKMECETSPSARTFSAILSYSARNGVKGMRPSVYRNSGSIITCHGLFSRGSGLIQKRMKEDGFEKYSRVCEKEAHERLFAFSLVYPKVTLVLTVKKKRNDDEFDEKELFRSQGNAIANLADFYGKEDVTVRALRPMFYEREKSGSRAPMRVSGYITWAQNYIHRRKIQYLYINRAHVKGRTNYHKTIEKSLEEIHKTKSSSCAYVLNIQTTTEDENDEESIRAFLREALEKISSERNQENQNVADSPRVSSASSSKKKRHIDDEQEAKKKQKQQCECCTIPKPPFQLNKAIVSPKKYHSSTKKWINPAFALINNREVLKLPPSFKTITSNELQESRVVGQFAKKFIVLITKDAKELILVDQHAADERIIVEELERNFLENRPGKTVSHEAKLDRDEYLTLCNFQDALVRFGFEWEEVGGILTIKLTRVPAPLNPKDSSASFNDFRFILHELAEKGGTTVSALPPSLRRTFAKKACRSAIMFGDQLSIKECEIIVKSLARCDFPFFCAHGRPTCLPVGAIND